MRVMTQFSETATLAENTVSLPARRTDGTATQPALEGPAFDGPAFDGPETYRISVRDLAVDWSIGVFDHEHHARQPLHISLDLDVTNLEDWEADDYALVPCYDALSERIRDLAGEGHVKLVETLAHKIALLCLEDTRIRTATIRVEKPEALKHASTVAVEVTRSRPGTV